MASFKTNVSNIAMALAANTGSDHVTKHHSTPAAGKAGKYSLTVTGSGPANPGTNGLPTPPNSVSPNLPPGGLRAKHINDSLALPPPAEVDSDIDLQDVDLAEGRDQPHPGLAMCSGTPPGLDVEGVITPALLAKQHLPGILLQHGPMAIRHVMSYLTESVSGFSHIPPAKARRLVVGALESRGGGGVNGNVEFEKVGWGRWDARVRGQPPRDNRTLPGNLSPPISAPSSYSPSNGGLLIPGGRKTQGGRKDTRSGASWTVSSIEENQDQEADENVTMAEHEADKMSLDEDDSAASCSSSSGLEESNPILDIDMGEDTDEEDWASIGAAALRQASFDARSGGGFNTHRNGKRRKDYNYLSANLAKSVPTSGPMLQRPSHTLQRYLSSTTDHDFTMMGAPEDDERAREREAVEALLKMGGSM